MIALAFTPALGLMVCILGAVVVGAIAAIEAGDR